MLPAPSSTRLVTIIAHVDHGKTTLADNLIESNGIISERLAGQLRYLDSDAEEQRRGITMRASAIGLKHSYLPTATAAAGKTKNGNNSDTNNSGGKNNNNKSNSNKNKNNNATEKKDMVIHLIDSPGHVDFSAEVTSSLLLCDSALLVIDAVEGLCARTHSLLREAYVHQLVPVLVINKIDRLHLDLGLDLNEAYVRIRELIESVNAVCASMVHTAKLDNVEGEGGAQSKDSILDNLQIPVQTQKIRTNKTSETRSKPQSAPNTKSETQSLTEDELESIWNFDPIKGNVVFTSALHGWGFTIPTLARSLFKTKALRNTDPANLMKPPVLRQFLFGDYKYNWEKEKVFKWKQQGAGAEEYTMFAEFALKPLWEIYEGVSEATFSVGLKSELFTDGIHVPVVNGPNNYTNNANISTSNSSNKKLENTKIKATTLGMERVISSLQTGSTSPSIISNNTNNERKVPSTTDEMQQLLSRTGASSESSIVSAVLRRYRPLSDAVLDAVCETCPSPEDASTKFRTRALALRDQDGGSSDNDSEFKRIQESVRHCKLGEDVPTVAHVCKFTSTNRSSVTDADLPPLPPGADPSSANMIMGIARVLSGTLRTEDVEYYMFGPRYTKSNDLNNAVPKQTIRCYLLMGSSFVRVSSVPAGHICAIYNLEGLQLKNVTICDRMNCMPLRGFDFGLQPLVKVNVEPVLASDTETLERGLLKLSLADASVEVTATSKGERILACLGEIHLERSILDLETVYCDHEIKLRISDPITSFCETTTWFENENDFDAVFNDKSPPLRQSTIPPYCYEEGLGYANRGRCRAVLSGRGAAIGIRAVPLPRLVYESLQNKKVVDGSDDELLMIGNALKCNADDSVLTAQSVLDTLLKSLCAVDANGNALFESNVLTMGYSAKAVQSSNGEIYIPRKEERPKDDEEEATIFEGMNEYNSTQTYIRKGLVESTPENSTTVVDPSAADMTALDIWKQDMRGSALAGFQLAMRAGPLCEEPVRGVAVILESVEIALTKRPSESDNSKQYRAAKDITGGIVVAALRSGIRCALLTRPARLVEGHLRLTLHSSLAGLGSLHAVLSKRRGKVVTDTMVDGTDLIRITATIPQAESFGLAPELLKKSSGEVTAPELVFSHWEVLDEDPFWIPTTEEEREDYGEILMNGDLSTGLDNNALKYIRMVRSRKGLMVDSSKIVVAAEKQRTLSRKK